MGINWMIKKELSQAIPPKFTEYIGSELIKYVRRREFVEADQEGETA